MKLTTVELTELLVRCDELLFVHGMGDVMIDPQATEASTLKTEFLSSHLPHTFVLINY